MPEKENYDLSQTNLRSELSEGVVPSDASVPKTAGEEIRKAISDMQVTVREQQLAADKQLQSLLGQASAYIESSQRLDQMLKAVQQVNPLVQSDDSIRANSRRIADALELISELAQVHQIKIAANLAQALQDGISSLAQASTALSEGQAFAQFAEAIKTWKANLTQVGPQGDVH
ncbi:MAG: hypothetical protein NUV93_06055 [Firmicutes bacterium]|nr:hypothetical protein [Bacillota bacterium]